MHTFKKAVGSYSSCLFLYVREVNSSNPFHKAIRDSDIVPRGGLVARFMDDKLGVKVLHSKAYRSPYPMELYGNIPLEGNPLPKGNEDLDLRP